MSLLYTGVTSVKLNVMLTGHISVWRWAMKVFAACDHQLVAGEAAAQRCRVVFQIWREKRGLEAKRQKPL